ncbi:hypothetical protein POKO110462_00020 [Pontibacter korlensis]|uniref:Type 1 periplasmic binding fold superfamily protein n=1 Tax=Pontibacter korlensis TaxID=400092 RepID=A0A0E3UVQ6_9BACT|nr:hypothetical protein [Pontibacter korlensis]AKD02687.1 hypothetical protein PKOR_05560 [Pontibacter korlensis]
MKKLFKPYLTAFFLGALLFSITSCSDDDDPAPVEEGENITSMTLTLEPVSTTKGISTATATFTAGNTPTLQLAPNTQYNATITFNDNIQDEIRAEAEDHEIFFSAPEDVLEVQKIIPDDFDANGRPVGLMTRVFTGNADKTGTLTVTLKHQEGLKDDDSDVSVGETDIEATFNVNIQ